MKANNDSKIQWSKFAGLASQWSVALTILIFFGRYLDQKIGRVTPLLSWLFPFLFILFSLFQIIRATQIKSKKE